MAKVVFDDGSVTVRTGLLTSRRFAWSELRLLFLVVPGAYKWHWITASSQRWSYLNLDPIAEDEFAKISGAVASIVNDETPSALREVQVVLGDYHGNYASFTLKDVKKSGVDLVAQLRQSRGERMRKLGSWLQCDPSIPLRGVFGQAVLDRRGYRLSSRTFVPWAEVASYQMETTNGIVCRFYVIPQGVSAGAFSFAKVKYSMLVSPGGQHTCTAECQFWRTLDAVEPGVEAPEAAALELGPQEKAIQKRLASGYLLVSREDDVVVMEKRPATVNWLVAVLLLLLCLPVGIIYVLAVMLGGRPQRVSLMPDGTVGASPA
jgi:hypothetical protein